MDADTRAAFDALMGLTTQNNEKIEKCLRHLTHHGEEIERLKDDNAAIKREVFGSSPPPPSAAVSAGPNGAAPPEPSLHRKTSEHDNEITVLAGQVQALRGEMATKEDVAKLADDVKTVKDINVSQNRTYGISKDEAPAWKKFVKFWGSRDGRNFGLTILVLILSALGYKTATDAKEATADVSKQVQRAEDHVVQSMPASVSASPTAASPPPYEPRREP